MTLRTFGHHFSTFFRGGSRSETFWHPGHSGRSRFPLFCYSRQCHAGKGGKAARNLIHERIETRNRRPDQICSRNAGCHMRSTGIKVRDLDDAMIERLLWISFEEQLGGGALVADTLRMKRS